MTPFIKKGTATNALQRIGERKTEVAALERQLREAQHGLATEIFLAILTGHTKDNIISWSGHNEQQIMKLIKRAFANELL